MGERTNIRMARSVTTGIVIPLITPFDENYHVDLHALESVVELTVRAGVHGLFVAGSAGMGPVMSVEERKAVCESSVKKVAHRVPVIVQIGAPDIQTTIELAKHAQEAGADALGCLPPYYYSDHSDTEVLNHFRKLADSVELPIYIYQNIRYTGIDIKPSLAKRIAEAVPSVCGIKVSHGSLEEVLRYVQALPKETAVFSGPILNLASGHQLGIKGSINPPTSIFPELAVAYWNAVVGGKYDEVSKLTMQIWSVLTIFMGSGTSKLRSYLEYAAQLRGLQIKHYPRWETDKLSEKDRSDVRAILTNLGLIATVTA
jgi:dihydrodipicolinate synthase/N-acetylneuraminate lyase